jgi:hypothetical protein
MPGGLTLLQWASASTDFEHSVIVIPEDSDYTHDIRVDSDTGGYFCHGVFVLSTLH